MLRFFQVAMLLVIGTGFSNLAFAARKAKADNSVQCLAKVLAGESDGTTKGMLDVGKVVMKRVQMHEGSICAVSYARGQFVGVRKAASKGAATKVLAVRVANQVIQQHLVGQFSQFRTAGFTRCKGETSHGNTYFNNCSSHKVAKGNYKHQRYGELLNTQVATLEHPISSMAEESGTESGASR